MESTRSTPPPYQQDHPDTLETMREFNTLQQYAHNHDQILFQRPDYQTFDINWNTAKLLEKARRKLRTVINETETILNCLEQREEFLLHKTKEAFNSIHTPEIRQRMHQEQQSPPLVPMSPLLLPSTTETPERNPTNNRQRPTPNTRTIRQNRMTRRCHLCQSQFHLKRNCPRYKCQRCFRFHPGHYTHECTTNESSSGRRSPSYDDYNYDYDPDGNLDGER
jgi:hypothetical protein